MHQRGLDRRILLRGIGAAVLGAPLARLLEGCSKSGNLATSTDGGATADATSTDAAADATTTEVATDGAAETTAETSTIAWATGGTASMKAKASYPNPFAGATLTTCALSCEMTQGPCWDSHAEVIQDISYGYTGLPMRMYLRVVDDACNPVANAIVEVWHVSAVGKYSGDDATNEDVSFCTGNDATFTSALYFRGKQTTDSNGVVFFDTCFPGWYSSRTIHVHFSVTIGGTNYVTAQLFFADSLDDEIVDTQPIYKDRGARDTTNATDMVISSSTVGDYEFQTSQMTDGAMLAWKTLIVRKSQSESSCSIGGSGGGGPGGDGGGPGMPPGAG